MCIRDSYTGCLTGGTLGVGQTTVKISPEKFMGTDYAGNLRDCVYQIQVEFMEGNTPYNVTYSYRIYDAGNPDMARADRFPLDTTVNGKEVTFESFTINGESYVAIRDFEMCIRDRYSNKCLSPRWFLAAGRHTALSERL